MTNVAQLGSDRNAVSQRQTQRSRVLQLLQAAQGRPVPSPALARISLQYCARIAELRKAGHRIISETKMVNGQRHGTFRLVEFTTATTEPTTGPTTARATPASDRLRAALFASFNEYARRHPAVSEGGRLARIRWAARNLGRKVTSFSELSEAEMRELLDVLRAGQRELFQPPSWRHEEQVFE
jgi:hypothetical protein